LLNTDHVYHQPEAQHPSAPRRASRPAEYPIWLLLRGRLDETRWFVWAAFLAFPSGFVAVLAGWFTAEIGRQPGVVYGLLRTKNAVTPSLTTADVGLSLAAYIAVYAVIYVRPLLHLSALA